MDTLEHTETAVDMVPMPIHERVEAVMDEVQSVGKDGFNKNQKYNFRGIDAVVNAVGPAFRRHGVVPVPVLQSVNYRDVKSAGGSPQREVTVIVRYEFTGPAGDTIAVTVPGEAMDSGDKGTAKAMSVAYRIALLQLLCIPTDEPDPDEASYERASGPTEESVELMASVEAAAHRGALKRVWDRVVAASTKGVITGAEAQGLSDRIKERIPELPEDPDAPEGASE